MERAMSTVATFNGVDTSRIAALSNKIQEEPAQGDTVWKAAVIWQGGFRNQIRIRDFPAGYADEPEALEGHIDLPVFLGLREGHAGYPDITVRVYLKADTTQQTLEELHQQVLKTSP